MDIQIQEIKKKEYTAIVSHFENKLPLWLTPTFVDCYKQYIILTVTKGAQTKGVWVVPFTLKGDQRIAKRKYRFFPYSSPFILEKDNLIRRKVTHGLFAKLISLCDEVDLPFNPSFKDFPTIQGLGGYVEWRHTHCLSKPLIYQQITSRLKNHIKSAKKQIEIIINNNPDYFDFDLAVKGSEEEKKLRKNIALELLKNNKAIIVSARNPNLCGGILIAFDNNCAYMFHSWQKEVVPRGIISALIFEAINWIFTHTKLRLFDFEGSIIQSIDYFFCGFNGNIIPYGHVFWSKNKEGLFNLINKSMNINGRLIKNY